MAEWTDLGPAPMTQPPASGVVASPTPQVTPQVPGEWTDLGPAGGSTAPRTAAPVVPGDAAEQIYGRMAQDPNYFPNADEWRALYDYENSRSTWDKTKGAIGTGLGAAKDTVVNAVKSGLEVTNPANALRIPATAISGMLSGTAQDYDFLRMLGSKAFDFVRDLGADDTTKFQHFMNRGRENLISQRALAAGNEGTGDFTPEQLQRLTGSNPLPETKNLVSTVASPIGIATLGAGDLIEAPFKAVATRAAKYLPAAAKVAEGVEKTGAVIKNVAAYPERKLAEAAEHFIPEGAQQAVKAGTGVAAMAGLSGHLPVIGPAAVALEAAKGVGSAVQNVGAFARHLAETYGDSATPRLLQMANDANAPKWIQTVARGLHNTGVGTAAELAGDTAKSAAKGAVIGGALGEATGEKAEDVGASVGAGAGLGTVFHAASVATGADARGKAMEARAGALRRFYLYLKERGTPDDIIQRVKDDPAIQISALRAGQARDLFQNRPEFTFLDEARFNTAAAASGMPGAGAFYDPLTKTIVLNVDDNSNRILHELPHAVAQASGASGEARLLIDHTLGPDRVEKLANEYASKILNGNLTAQGIDPASLAQPDYLQHLAATREKLDAANNGNGWIYDEIYAEAGYGSLQGKDLADVTRNPLWQRLGATVKRKYLEAVGKNIDSGTGQKMIPGGALFSDPEVYGNPALRKMFYEHLRQVHNEGAKAGIPVEAGAPVAPALVGKHPSTPLSFNPATKRMESDLAVQLPDGSIQRRKLKEVRAIEKGREAATKAALETLPVKPVTDTTPEVAPRKDVNGKVEVRGTSISNTLATLPQFSEQHVKNAKLLESLMGKGDAAKVWYWAVESGAFPKDKNGNVKAQQIEFAPYDFHLSKRGNVLARGLSLTAMERKLAKWTANKKLGLWDNDPGLFRADLKKYLQNHAEGVPGAEGLTSNGEAKRNLLNTFVIGDNRAFHDLNPLRDTLRGDDKNGLIRSFRIDRMGVGELSSERGWQTEYESKVKNLSPKVDERPRPQRQFLYSPDVEEKQQRAPNEEVRKVAADYLAERGITLPPHVGYANLDESRSKQWADAYDAATHDPHNPEVQNAYQALGDETRAQWDAIVASGVKMEPWTGEGQPYKTSAEMRADVATNKHLWYFPTEGGFGEEVLHNENPMLARSGVEVGGKEIPVNDLFRAVHDYFGHAKEGYEFGPRGEYNAFLAHSRMFSDEARRAMATETNGQNSWVNFGKQLRDEAGNVPKKGEPGYVPVTERPYAEQKAFLYPQEMVDEAAGLKFSPKVEIDKKPQVGEAPRSNESENEENPVRQTARPVDGGGSQGVGRAATSGTRATPQAGSGGAVVSASPRIRPKDSGEKVTLRHYSERPDLKELDPTHHGSGILGAEAARRFKYPDIYQPRAYYGMPGYEKEAALGPHLYTRQHDTGRLYQYQEDPRSLWPTDEQVRKAGYNPSDDGARRTLYEKKIKDAGYDGFRHRDSNVAVMFKKMPVEKVSPGARKSSKEAAKQQMAARNPKQDDPERE